MTTLYVTHGTTSRGRIGIDANLRAVTLAKPWFVDPKDKAVMVTAVNEFLTTMKQGALYFLSRNLLTNMAHFAVPNITAVTPNSTIPISDHGKSLSPSNRSFAHACHSG